MSQSIRRPGPEDVEHLLRNAQLRDELEPYLDESITCLDLQLLPTPVENEYLESMLAWERAPSLPLAEWFDPPLKLPHPDSLSPDETHDVLWATIYKLYEKRIILDFTDHLSDRQLYTLICRDILLSCEKKIDSPGNYLHWDCADASGDPDIWLRYYATPEERRWWAEISPNQLLPPAERPPHPRLLPRQPL